MECGICLEKKDNINVNYPCGHLFCPECILYSIETNGPKCPICNTRIKDTIKIFPNSEEVVECRIDHLISLNSELEDTRRILQEEVNQLKLAIIKMRSTMAERQRFIDETIRLAEEEKEKKMKKLNDLIYNVSKELKYI